ncbi:uncharacterized protein [Eucyclogobius newberryi]|uniref:uncharacterized protein n=1 Tax=Eucyclogobius newberryi TaxID=166745 RepID=UPI003B5B4A85
MESLILWSYIWNTGRTRPCRCFKWPHRTRDTSDECLIGIVGRPVLLPCFHHELFTFHNVSVEWRRGSELVLRAEWEDGNVVIWSLNSATIPHDAPFTGNFSLELPKVNPKEDQTVYSLFLTSVENDSENDSVPLCSMCLRTADGAKEDTFRSRASEGMWMFSTGLCVAVGIMVGAGVAYQIHLDRLSKKRKLLCESTKHQRGYKKHQFLEETEEETLTSKETCV